MGKKFKPLLAIIKVSIDNRNFMLYSSIDNRNFSISLWNDNT